MKKMPTIFVRDEKKEADGSRKINDEMNTDAEWVFRGEGRSTRKWDGQAVKIDNGRAFKRYDAKRGRTPTADFKPAEPAPDPISGHWPGWVPVTEHDRKAAIGQSLRWAEEHLFPDGIPDGTYEAVGPSISTRHGVNPEKLDEQILVAHGADTLDVPRDFTGLMEYLADADIEGVVWHHPDGRMAKIKRSDFRYPEPDITTAA